MSFLDKRVDYLLRSARRLSKGCCTDGSKKRTTYVHLPIRSNQSAAVEFIFCAPVISMEQLVFAGVTTSCALALSLGGAPLSVAAACVPIIVPISNSLLAAGVPISDDVKRSMNQFLMANSAQLSFGMLEFLTGDVVNGMVHMVMAGAGFYVAKVEGIALLPSYSVACTIFAGMSTLQMFQMFFEKGTINGDRFLSENVLRLGTIAHPFLYIACAYLAWKLIEQLRTGLLDVNGYNFIGATAAQVVGNGSDINITENQNNIVPLAALVEPANPSREPFAGRGFRLNSTAAS